MQIGGSMDHGPRSVALGRMPALDNQQQAVVDLFHGPPGPVLVLASAGSGMTTTLAHAIFAAARFCQYNGVPVSACCALSFSNAAQDALEYALYTAGIPASGASGSPDDVLSLTFNKLAWRLIARFRPELNRILHRQLNADPKRPPRPLFPDSESMSRLAVLEPTEAEEVLRQEIQQLVDEDIAARSPQLRAYLSSESGWRTAFDFAAGSGACKDCKAATQRLHAAFGLPGGNRFICARHIAGLVYNRMETCGKVVGLVDPADWRWSADDKYEWRLMLAATHRFQHRCRAEGRMTYSDTLIDATELLSDPGAEGAAVRAFIRERFLFLFVDEVQDTGRLHFNIAYWLCRALSPLPGDNCHAEIGFGRDDCSAASESALVAGGAATTSSLAGVAGLSRLPEVAPRLPALRAALEAQGIRGPHIAFFGDPHQSIFSYQGADPGVRAVVMQAFPTVRIMRLQHNYRSLPAIVAVAQAVGNIGVASSDPDALDMIAVRCSSNPGVNASAHPEGNSCDNAANDGSGADSKLLSEGPQDRVCVVDCASEREMMDYVLQRVQALSGPGRCGDGGLGAAARNAASDALASEQTHTLKPGAADIALICRTNAECGYVTAFLQQSGVHCEHARVYESTTADDDAGVRVPDDAIVYRRFRLEMRRLGRLDAARSAAAREKATSASSQLMRAGDDLHEARNGATAPVGAETQAALLPRAGGFCLPATVAAPLSGSKRASSLDSSAAPGAGVAACCDGYGTAAGDMVAAPPQVKRMRSGDPSAGPGHVPATKDSAEGSSAGATNASGTLPHVAGLPALPGSAARTAAAPVAHVWVGSVHSAKGKEWRHVLLPYFCHRSFPHYKALSRLQHCGSGNLTPLGIAVRTARSSGHILTPFPAAASFRPGAACLSNLLPDRVTHVAALSSSASSGNGCVSAASATTPSALRSGASHVHSDVFATPLRWASSEPGTAVDSTADTLAMLPYPLSQGSNSEGSQGLLSCSPATAAAWPSGAAAAASSDAGSSSEGSGGLVISPPRGAGGRGAPSPQPSTPGSWSQAGAAAALPAAYVGAGSGPRSCVSTASPPVIALEGTLPPDTLSSIYTKIAEEKRIAHVALSRACDTLCILRPCQRRGAAVASRDATKVDSEEFGREVITTCHSPFLHPLTKQGLQWTVTWQVAGVPAERSGHHINRW
jgi:superfamily I DNA/RNA helicase